MQHQRGGSLWSGLTHLWPPAVFTRADVSPNTHILTDVYESEKPVRSYEDSTTDDTITDRVNVLLFRC